MVRWVVLAVAVVVIASSGCLDSGSDPTLVGPGSDAPPVKPTGQAPPPAPTEDFGSLVVTVVTSEQTPVSTAQVLLDGKELAAFTDASGRATFNDLLPGSYTVLVAKPGYRTAQDKGRVAPVSAGQVAEVTMTLDPVPVVDESNNYYASLPFNGFISCSFHGRVVGYTSYCGRGVSPGGVTIGRDPNDNSTHEWQVENLYVTAMIGEVSWTSSTSLGTTLWAQTSRDMSCTTYGTCMPSNSIGSGSGTSPIYYDYYEGTENNITRRLGREPAAYPRTVWTDVRAYCDEDCTLTLVYNQQYEAWVTTFYGSDPPPGFRIFPPAS